jgi:hypothetical protein
MYCHVRFHVLTVTSMKMTAFWDVALCSLIKVHQCFKGAYYFHHQDDSGSSTPLKHRSTSTRIHGAISQKAVIFSVLLVYKVIINVFRNFTKFCIAFLNL